MTSLSWRTLKIIKFAERHSVFLQNLLADTVPIKIFIFDFGGERRAAKCHFCPCLLLPSPFSSLPCTGSTPATAPVPSALVAHRAGASRNGCSSVLGQGSAPASGARGRAGGGRARDARAEARPWQTADTREASGGASGGAAMVDGGG